MTDLSKKTDKQLLAIVRKGQEAFFQTANAIWEIDQRQLWKTTAKSLAEFCETEFSMSPADVSRYKGAARVLRNLAEFETLPTNEGQARELVRLRHADPQKTVWKAVLERIDESGEAISGRLIREVAESVLDEPETESQPEPEIVISGIGRLVQITQALSGLMFSEDERADALVQLDVLQTTLDDLRKSLA